MKTLVGSICLTLAVGCTGTLTEKSSIDGGDKPNPDDLSVPLDCTMFSYATVVKPLTMQCLTCHVEGGLSNGKLIMSDESTRYQLLKDQATMMLGGESKLISNLKGKNSHPFSLSGTQLATFQNWVKCNEPM